MTDQPQLIRPSFPGVTIDAAHSRDLDDAVWVERNEEGWRVTVSIADVSAAVPVGCPEDEGAYTTAFTRYAATWAVHPMLPFPLSEGQLTLSPDRLCDVLGVEMHLSPQRTVTDVRIAFGTLAHRGRLSHEAASALIDGGDPDLHRMLADAWKLSSQLLHDRRAGGALTYFSAKSGLSTDEEGNLVDIGTQGPVSRAYVIVQELMILANRTVAEHYARKGVCLLYRNHRANPLASRVALREDVECVAEGRGQGDAAAGARLSMFLGRATLDAQATGHFGLNLPVYAWFTSPIRRYADLVNQRVIKAALHEAPPPYTPERLEEIARHLNVTAWAEADVRSAAFKEASERRARQIISKETFSSLDQVGFQAVVKAAFVAEGQADSIPDLLGQEVISRLAASQLTEKDTSRVLLSFGRAPTPLKLSLLQGLQENTALAQRMLAYMAQTHGLAVAEWDEAVAGPPHARRFLCRASAALDDERYESVQVVAGRRSDAQQRASVALLAKVSQVDWQPPLEWTAAVSAKAPRSPFKKQPGNPKGQLQEVCQKRRWPMPVYDVTQSGSAHAPLFHGRVRIEVPGHPAKGSLNVVGASRREVEHQAAADLMKKLLGQQEDAA